MMAVKEAKESVSATKKYAQAKQAPYLTTTMD
jgi:hypothetical protein